MSRRSFLLLAVWASLGAVFVGSFSGQEQTLSLRVWLVVFAIWVGVGLLSQLMIASRLTPSRVRLLVAPAPKDDERRSSSLLEFRLLEGLVLRTRDNERIHGSQMRPRLIKVADHALLVHHGIDRQTDPDSASSLLGDVGWLIDEPEPTTPPTLDQIERFLDLLLPHGPDPSTLDPTTLDPATLERDTANP